MDNWTRRHPSLSRSGEFRLSDRGGLGPVALLRRTTLADAIPHGRRRLHEVMSAGIRVSCCLDHGRVRVLTRDLRDWTERFPGIVAAVATLGAETAIIDGKAVVIDGRGASSFTSLRRALGKDGDPASIRLVAFDLLHVDGADLHQVPLEERRAALGHLLREQSRIIMSEDLEAIRTRPSRTQAGPASMR